MALEPVYNILVSMGALAIDEETSGLNEWVARTIATLPTSLVRQNEIIFGGLGLEALTNICPRGPASEDFPTYLAFLAAQEPVALRYQLLYWKIHSPTWRTFFDSVLLPEPEVEEVVADPTVGIRFFEERAREKFDR
ncbi:MAG TPA: hypothetical protein PKE45_16265, partial [Caldilineaceae bacterium]|nr:hypothetical protein [Caldilineaceae bacterium]